MRYWTSSISKYRLSEALLLAIVLGIVLQVMAGCAAVGLAPVSSQKPHTPQEIAQAAINEANATLTAINSTIASNVKEGIFTKAEAQDYLNQSISYGKRVDQAKALLDSGNISDAKTQADILQSLILSLQRKVAEKVRTQ